MSCSGRRKKWIEDGLLWFRSRLVDDRFFQNKILLQSKLFDKRYHVISNYDTKGNAREKGTLTNGTGTLFSYGDRDNLLFIQHYEARKPVKLERFNLDSP
jgi:hypothetical protein